MLFYNYTWLGEHGGTKSQKSPLKEHFQIIIIKKLYSFIFYNFNIKFVLL